MGVLGRFKRWAKRNSRGRRLLCHFYIAQEKEASQKQYYGKDDYAYFNLFSHSPEWLVKGTPGHGISSRRGRRSSVPCLNCFEIDEKFYEALDQLYKEGNERFQLGIILNKRKLLNDFSVIDVSTDRPEDYPSPNKCHYYDNPRFRSGPLNPFNYCNVVRIEIKRSNELNVPIVPIPRKTLMGLLVKDGSKRVVRRLLKQKKMEDVEVFSVL